MGTCHATRRIEKCISTMQWQLNVNKVHVHVHVYIGILNPWHEFTARVTVRSAFVCVHVSVTTIYSSWHEFEAFLRITKGVLE